MTEDIFDTQQELPSSNLDNTSKTLIGFSKRYNKIKNHLVVMLFPKKLEAWSKKYHKEVLPLCNVIQNRYPLFLFSGDVGTGKTVTAECIANRLTTEMEKEGFLLKLSTRVRGRGLHGEMSNLIQDAFQELKQQAGKKRLAFLLIDEADSIASLRGTEQMHQEEKAAISTLIQKIDEIRSVGGRAIIFLCTNRVNVIDQAIVRRSALHMTFERPNEEECLELLKKDLEGLGIKDNDLRELVMLTRGDGTNGYTFSDFRLRFLPDAIISAFPEKPLTFEILKTTALSVKPSPSIS